MAIVQNIFVISGKSLERTASLLFHLNSALCRTITWQTSTSRLPWTNTLLVSNNISLVCLIILLHLETWRLESGDFHLLSLEKNTIISFKKIIPKAKRMPQIWPTISLWARQIFSSIRYIGMYHSKRYGFAGIALVWKWGETFEHYTMV